MNGMKANIALLLALGLFGFLELNSQDGAVDFSNSTPGANYGGNFLSYADAALFDKAIKTTDEDAYNNIDGSPFLSDEFIKGRLWTTDGVVIVDVPLKLNFYSNEIIALGLSGQPFALDERNYLKITLPYEGRELVFKRINNSRPNVFYEVLYESEELTFFKERYVTIKESKNYGLSASPQKFSPRARYFIIQNGGHADKTKLKKKNLLALFPPSLAKKMEDYAEENHLILGKESDWVKVFAGIFE